VAGIRALRAFIVQDRSLRHWCSLRTRRLRGTLCPRRCSLRGNWPMPDAVGCGRVALRAGRCHRAAGQRCSPGRTDLGGWHLESTAFSASDRTGIGVLHQ
jgi:hypothetical protein